LNDTSDKLSNSSNNPLKLNLIKYIKNKFSSKPTQFNVSNHSVLTQIMMRCADFANNSHNFLHRKKLGSTIF